MRRIGHITAETANSQWRLPASPSPLYTQTFNVTSGAEPMIRKQGKIRPSLVIRPAKL